MTLRPDLEHITLDTRGGKGTNDRDQGFRNSACGGFYSVRAVTFYESELFLLNGTVLGARGVRGNHLSNTTRPTRVFFKSGESCSEL